VICPLSFCGRLRGRRASYRLGGSVDVEIARIDASTNELELRPV
jgi:hypothetical protein